MLPSRIVAVAGRLRNRMSNVNASAGIGTDGVNITSGSIVGTSGDRGLQTRGIGKDTNSPARELETPNRSVVEITGPISPTTAVVLYAR